MNRNGVVPYGPTPADYQTDVIADRRSTPSEREGSPQPFFLWVTPLAPHPGNRRSVR